MSDITELTPVQRDLLSVLRAIVTGSIPNNPPEDWGELLKLARFHQLDRFFYPAVSVWDSGFLPDVAVMERWRNGFLSIAAQYTHASLEIAELLSALHDADISVVPLKGVWLAENIYDDGVCRPMRDVDLLIQPDDLDNARRVFEYLGYKTNDYYIDINRDKHIHYQQEDGLMPIELHWSLWSKKEIEDFDGFKLPVIWDNLYECKLFDVPVLNFPLERQLVYIVYHILQHNMAVPLRAYLDLVLFCRHFALELDLALLKVEAEKWNLLFGVKFILQVAFDICGELLPESLSGFLLNDGEYENERRVALHTALQLNDESEQITPAVAACRQMSLLQRLRLGISKIFVSPNTIRSYYTKSVRRSGIVGGYISRCVDLICRRRQLSRIMDPGDSSMNLALDNFNTRCTLNKWVCSDGKLCLGTGD